MSYQPNDKIRFMEGLSVSPDWAIVCEEVDLMIKSFDQEISNNLKKKNYDMASHLNGKKEMAEILKSLPRMIKRKNQGIIERIKDLVS